MDGILPEIAATAGRRHLITLPARPAYDAAGTHETEGISHFHMGTTTGIILQAYAELLLMR